MKIVPLGNLKKWISIGWFPVWRVFYQPSDILKALSPAYSYSKYGRTASRIQQMEETVLFMFTMKAICKVNMKNGTQSTVGMRKDSSRHT